MVKVLKEYKSKYQEFEKATKTSKSNYKQFEKEIKLLTKRREQLDCQKKQLEKELAKRNNGEQDVEKCQTLFEYMEKEWEEGKVTMGQQVDALKKECADLQEKIKVKKDEAAKAE